MTIAARRYYAGENGLGRLMRMLPASDRALLEGTDPRAHLLQDAREATRQGGAGTVGDALCYASGLESLDLSRITGPVVFVHGTADTVIWPRVAEAAHRKLPGSRLRLVDGPGHFMIAAHPELLLDEIALA